MSTRTQNKWGKNDEKKRSDKWENRKEHTQNK